MQNFIKLTVALCLCLVGSHVLADPITDIYQVEIILFEHTDANRFKAEHWPKFVNKIDTSKAVNLNNLPHDVPDSLDTLETLDALDEAGEKPTNKVVQESITLIDAKRYLLNNEERTIKSNKQERFIKHLAWNQPLATNVRSTPVYFTAGKEQEIAGTISIKPARNNVFTVSLDINYKIQPEDRKDNPGVEEIKLQRDVRVKKKEVYYVDHPVIGMMIIISPVVYGTTSYSPLPNL